MFRKIKTLKVNGKEVELSRDDIHSQYFYSYEERGELVSCACKPGEHDYIRVIYKELDPAYRKLMEKCLTPDKLTNADLDKMFEYDKLFQAEYRYDTKKSNKKARYYAHDKVNKMMRRLSKVKECVWLYNRTSPHHMMKEHIYHAIAMRGGE